MRYIAIAPKLGVSKGPELISAQVSAGRALVGLKRPAEAVQRFEGAFALLAGFDGQRALKAEAQLGLADALWAVGEERTRARDLGLAAANLFESMKRGDDAKRARAWVEAHHL